MTLREEILHDLSRACGCAAEDIADTENSREETAIVFALYAMRDALFQIQQEIAKSA